MITLIFIDYREVEQDLSSREGYMDRYLEHSENTATFEEAYRRTEEEHRAIFKRPHYSSYGSFRGAKRRFFKQTRCR